MLSKKDQMYQPRLKFIMTQIKRTHTARDACRNMDRSGRSCIYKAFRANAVLTGLVVQRIVDALELDLPVYPPISVESPVDHPEYARFATLASDMASEAKGLGLRVTTTIEHGTVDPVRDAMEALQCPAQ